MTAQLADNSLRGVQYEEHAATLSLIGREGYFAVRGMKLDSDHVKALAGRIRNIGALDPVLLWQGKGGFVLLDGAHRVEAYQKAGWTDPIPARIAHCDRRTALLLAVQANSKITLAMSNADRSNLAWRLVRELDRAGAYLFTKRQIIDNTGVSKGTVDNMRATLVTMQKAGREPSGNWSMDRMADHSGGWGDDVADEERERMVEELAADLRRVLNVKGRLNDELIAMALQRAAGDHKLKGWMDFLYPDDEAEEDWASDDDEDAPSDF